MQPKARVTIFVLVSIAAGLLGLGARATNDYALNAAAINEVCKVSKALKKISRYAATSLKEAIRTVETLESNVARLQLNITSTPDQKSNTACENPRKVWKETQKTGANLRKRLLELAEKGSYATAYAGVSAGRLEEFVMAFTQARSADSSTGTQCVAIDNSGGNVAAASNLNQCFSAKTSPSKAAAAIDEESIEDIEKLWGQEETKPDGSIAEIIAGIAYSKVDSSLRGASAGKCHLLLTGNGGMLASATVGKKFLWGGGVLTLAAGSSQDGVLTQSNKLNGLDHDSGSITGTQNGWTADPATKIRHFQKTVQAVGDLKDLAQEIDSEAQAASDKLAKCLGRLVLEGESTGLIQLSNFAEETANRLNETALELREAKKTLERYRMEKGELKPLPSKADGQEPPAVSPVHAGALYESLNRAVIFALLGVLADII